jgi:7-cyano-7-deazaguanine synthase
MTSLDVDAALVLFSGGQDSTTCVAWALEHFRRVETIGFSYGQRHSIEMEVRLPIREALLSAFPAWSARLGADSVVSLDVLSSVSRSALLDMTEFAKRDDGLPNTFVPGRNLVFLTFAAIVAVQRGIKTLVTGVCETDFSGYPDCRDDTMKALQVALNLGMESRLIIQTPLMLINKAQTWDLASQLGGKELVSLIKEMSHSCYLGDRVNRNEWGYGCGTCDACKLRASGWYAYVSKSAGG